MLKGKSEEGRGRPRGGAAGDTPITQTGREGGILLTAGAWGGQSIRNLPSAPCHTIAAQLQWLHRRRIERSLAFDSSSSMSNHFRFRRKGRKRRESPSSFKPNRPHARLPKDRYPSCEAQPHGEPNRIFADRMVAQKASYRARSSPELLGSSQVPLLADLPAPRATQSPIR